MYVHIYIYIYETLLPFLYNPYTARINKFDRVPKPTKVSAKPQRGSETVFKRLGFCGKLQVFRQPKQSPKRLEYAVSLHVQFYADDIRVVVKIMVPFWVP